MQKFLSVAALGLLLAGCNQTTNSDTVQAPTPTSAWKIDTRIDRLTDKQISTVSTTITNVRAASKQTGANIAVLGFSCETAMIVFGGIIGGPGNSVVSFRVDAQPANNSVLEVRPSLDAVSAQGAKAAQLVKALMSGQSLYVRVSSATIGLTELDVSLAGFADAARSAGLACAK